MATEAQPRTLVAILHADVAGFSRLTEQDEDATFRDLKQCLGIFSSNIARHRGRIVNTAGDAVLATFGSAQDALSCAARIQTALTECNAALPEERKILFRVGLNLGDVIGNEGDIFGDGVNVAARIQALAEPGGICVSGSFYDAVGQRMPFDYEFLGEQHVKNIAKPVRAYHARLQPAADLDSLSTTSDATPRRRIPFRHVAGAALVVIAAFAAVGLWHYRSAERTAEPVTTDPATASSAETAALPRVAVLPFVNRSDDPEQDYFADGVSEDIITDLSSLSGLVVIARNASFRYKDTGMAPQDVAKELMADYLLVGSIRKGSGRLRITAELVNARDGTQAWAERYDRQLDDMFALQDDVTRNIVKAMAVRLTPREEQQIEQAPTSKFEAYDLFLQGQKLYAVRSPEANKAAQEAYRKAIELDPGYGRAYGALAVALVMDYRRYWNEAAGQETLERALEMAKEGVRLNPDLPQAYWSLGFTHLFRKEYEAAADAVEQAVKLAPNYADGYGLLAFINNHIGRAEEAIREIDKATALNPHYTFDYPWNRGWAYYTLGQYDKAVESLSEALERNENLTHVRLFLAASYEALGRHDDAQWEIERVLVTNPSASIELIKNTSAIADPKQLAKFLGHLRSAGLPESQ